MSYARIWPAEGAQRFETFASIWLVANANVRATSARARGVVVSFVSEMACFVPLVFAKAVRAGSRRLAPRGPEQRDRQPVSLFRGVGFEQG
eukprot:7275163-Lingulodinium_polyedra.AAC.1